MTATTHGRVLVAGLGNIFLGDDGFGVEVARRLSSRPLPPQVEVSDIGIRGVHLAFDLLDRPYDVTILIDTMMRGAQPGTVCLFEPYADAPRRVSADAHAMTPASVLAYLRTIGGDPGQVWIVGCEPSSIDERMGLTPPVEAAVDRAVELVLEIIDCDGSAPPTS